MGNTHIDRDPFSDTTDPAAYVPRTATEAVLLHLEMALRDGARVVCLAGPPGAGKTLLLNVLEERLAGDFRPLRVLYPKLDPDEFLYWALAVLREPAAGDPERAFVRRIGRDAAQGEPPLVWIVDDADCLPAPTLRKLLALQRSAGDAMHVLMSRSGEFPSEDFAQIGVVPVTIELEGEMDNSEMAHYVQARLVHAGVDAEQRAKIEAGLDQLYARSHGNPRLLHAAASVLLCFGSDHVASPVAEPSTSAAPRAPRDPAPRDSEESGAERLSIESLVAEAVASEHALDEIAAPDRTTSFVRPQPDPVLEPAPAPVPSAPSTPEPDASAPAPRKRHRLRRFGRR